MTSYYIWGLYAHTGWRKLHRYSTLRGAERYLAKIRPEGMCLEYEIRKENH